MSDLLDWLCSIFWPPLFFYLREQKHNAQDRAAYADFYQNQYIPYITETWPKERIKEFNEPSLFLKYIN